MRLNLEAKSDNEIAILAYLEENASEALAEKINSGKKTMADCIGYIREQARKKAKNGMAMIRDVEVFGWATHYFEEDALKPGAVRDSFEKVGVDKQIVERKLEEAKKKATELEKKKKEEAKHGLDGQLDMFELMGGM